jgi:thiamine biosynthesis protein ThiI
MQKTVIVRYGELALKSWPVRRRFERRLISSIKLALQGLRYVIRKEYGRIFVDTKFQAAAARRLCTVPGVVSVSPAAKVKADMDEIMEASLRVARRVITPGSSFAVRTSRVGKHTFSSSDVNARVGSAILSEVGGARVDLSGPDHEIFIEVRGGDAYVFTEVVEGIGGLPAGTQGRVVVLFSGRSNDVVAAYLMIKRGCALSPLFPSPDAYGRVTRFLRISVRKLTQFDPELELRVVPFGKVIRRLEKVSTPGHAYYIYKRSILRAAEALARQLGAEAVVLADDIRDVAAQKLANLPAIDGACELPVLRPLAGLGAAETGRLKAKLNLPRLVEPHCPFSLPRAPVDLGKILSLEENIGISALVKESLLAIKLIRLGRIP